MVAQNAIEGNQIVYEKEKKKTAIDVNNCLEQITLFTSSVDCAPYYDYYDLMQVP